MNETFAQCYFNNVLFQEKPQNMIEVEIGGEGSSAMLRLLHLQQDSIPDTIQVKPLWVEYQTPYRLDHCGFYTRYHIG